MSVKVGSHVDVQLNKAILKQCRITVNLVKPFGKRNQLPHQIFTSDKYFCFLSSRTNTVLLGCNCAGYISPRMLASKRDLVKLSKSVTEKLEMQTNLDEGETCFADQVFSTQECSVQTNPLRYMWLIIYKK